MKPLHPFYTFSNYVSREIYNAASGNSAAPWDPNRPLKYWADSTPSDIEVDEERGEVTTYKPVLAMLPNGRYKEGLDGQPTLGKITLTVAVAKSYNFPPLRGSFPALGELFYIGDNAIRITPFHIANSQRFVQCPLTLPEGARVVYAPGIGGIVAVLLKGETMPGSSAPGDGFTEADRKLLQAIYDSLTNRLARIETALLKTPTPIR